ncbi:unnamed protein product, partial [Effrenium voratum]
AMRSAFTYSKDVKELLRGGLENGDFIRNYDMKACPVELVATHSGDALDALHGRVQAVALELAVHTASLSACPSRLANFLASSGNLSTSNSMPALISCQYIRSGSGREALGNRFAYKPYRPRAELLQTLARTAGLPPVFMWEEQ